MQILAAAIDGAVVHLSSHSEVDQLVLVLSGGLYFSNSCSGFGWERRVSGDTCSDAVQTGMHSYYTMRYTCHSALESRVPSPADIDRIAFVLSKSRTQKP